VFGAVMIGGTIAVERAARSSEGSWYCARDKRDNSLPSDGFAFFGGAASGGGSIGGVAGAFIASIAAVWQRKRNDRKFGRNDHSSNDEDPGS